MKRLTIAAIVLLSAAIPAAAQTVVERRVDDLERRVKALESVQHQTQPAPSNTQSAWRKLRKGMSTEQVRAILGEPDHIDVGGFESWRWKSGGHVVYYHGAVDSWLEPQPSVLGWSEPQPGALGAWPDRIRAKIRGNIIVPQGIPGNSEAIFDVTLLPTGEVATVSKTKSSGYPHYDAAVERAIMKSSPLPLPDDSSLFHRQLQLGFRPVSG